MSENERVFQMTDKQLLDVLRARGNDLQTLSRFQFLERMFTKAAETNPAAANGLHAAIGLMKLYSLSIATGHENHPFKDFDGTATVTSILATADETARRADKLLAPAVTPGTVRRKERVAIVRTADELEALRAANKLKMESRIGKQRGKAADPNSKLSRAKAAISEMTGEFSQAHAVAEVRKTHPDIYAADVGNALSNMVRKGMIDKLLGWGRGYRAIPKEKVADPAAPQCWSCHRDHAPETNCMPHDRALEAMADAVGGVPLDGCILL